MSAGKEMLAAAEALADQIVADRRLIHSQPELAYEEVKTAAFVADRLRDLGIEAATGVGGTGVVGLLKGAQAGRTVLLCADMDALPIQEISDVDYASKSAGAMHACGHDGHTAMLLGAARLLSERKGAVSGTIKFMFQPAEEGGFGALKMIEDGLLDSPKVDGAFALHVNPLLHVGRIGLRVGAASAAGDRFTILINGSSGHAARPNLAVDPIVIAAQLITALQTLVSREVAPEEQAVVTVGALDAGTTENIIPDTARIRGTVRTYSPVLRAFLEKRIGELSAGIAAAMRASAEFTWRPGYPSMVNNEASISLIHEAAVETLGEAAPVEAEPTMGAEDFSYVQERVPGAMFRLGVRDRSWETPRPTHSSSFDMDEAALPIGAAVMATTALKFLDQG